MKLLYRSDYEFSIHEQYGITQQQEHKIRYEVYDFAI